MKARFAIISAVSFWLYAVSDFIKNAIETFVHAKLIVGGASYSSADYAIEVSYCQKVLLIFGGVSVLLFIVDTLISLVLGMMKLSIRNKFNG